MPFFTPKRWRWHFSWREFRNSLLATLVLGLALGSALASTVAAKEGKITVAFTLAMISLVLAFVIALTVVPKLFRRARQETLTFSINFKGETWFYVLFLAVVSIAGFISKRSLAFVIPAAGVAALLFRKARRKSEPFFFSITHEGWFYLLALLIVAVAAFNTGNNLIFIILSAGLSLVVVSEILSSLNLWRLDFNLDLPATVPARQEFKATLSLHNLKVSIPSFSLIVTNTNAISKVTQTDSPAKPHPSTGLRPPSPQGRGAGSEGNCHTKYVCTSREAPFSYIPRDGHFSLGGLHAYFPFLSGSTLSHQTKSLRFPRRGLYCQNELEISTRFPFGFARKRKKSPHRREIIVLPEVEPPNEFFEMLPLLNGAFESYLRGPGSDLYSIRDYSCRDNARFLDWKATAKTGQLMVREFTREDDRKCCLIFDNFFEDFSDTNGPAFEKAVKLCANAARHFHEMDSEIRLVTSNAATDFSKSADGLLEILKLLALVEPSSQKVQPISELASDTAFKILFTASRPGEIPTKVWSSSHVVFIREL